METPQVMAVGVSRLFLAAALMVGAGARASGPQRERLEAEVTVVWKGNRTSVDKHERGQLNVEEQLTVTWEAKARATAAAGTRPWELDPVAEAEDISLTVTGSGKATCSGRVDDKVGERTVKRSWTWRARKQPTRQSLFKRSGHALAVSLPRLTQFDLAVDVKTTPSAGDDAAALVATGCAVMTVPAAYLAASAPQIQAEAAAVLKKDKSFYPKLEVNFDGKSRSFVRTGRASYTHATGPDSSKLSGSIDVHYTVRLNQEPAGVEADPGDPREVVRAEPVELDGSGSKGKNLSYTWTFTPLADCPKGASFRAGPKRAGARVRFRALCGVKASLLVSDGSAQDSKSTDVTVTPREGEKWRTVVHHRSDWSTKPPWREAALSVTAGGQARGIPPFLLGENWCAFDHGATPRGVDSIGVIHPHGKRLFGDWLGHGWRKEKLTDPGGPFDGWYFVASAEELEINRVAVFNVELHPDAGPPRGHTQSWRALNAARLTPAGMTRALGSLEAHEGMGNPRVGQGSGHSAIFRDVVAEPENDPRAALEAMVDADEADLMNRVEAELTRINTLLAEESKKLDQNSPNDPTKGVHAFFPDDGSDQWYDYGMGER